MPVENAWASYCAKRWETLGVKTLFRRFPQLAFKQFYQFMFCVAQAYICFQSWGGPWSAADASSAFSQLDVVFLLGEERGRTN